MKKHIKLFGTLLIVLNLSACNPNSLNATSQEPFQLPTDTIKAPSQEPFQLPSDTIKATPQETFQLPTDENGCILPLESFAYFVWMESDKPRPGANAHVLPLSPWQVEGELPVFPAELPTHALISIARTVDNKFTEIWVRRGPSYYPLDYDKDYPTDLYQFSVYRPELKTWKIIPAKVDGAEIFVTSLYVLPDGSLWGRNEWHDPQGLGILYLPLFSKFNEVTERFELVDEADDLPTYDISASGFARRSKIELDPNGVFWILMSGEAIYSYNPFTQEVKQHLEIPDFRISAVAIDSQNNMFFQDYDGIGSLITDSTLYQYSTETGELIEISYAKLEPWPSFFNLLVDHGDRLWLGGVAWREPNGDLYQVHRSSVFETNVIEDGFDRRWKTPYILMESSDGRLWFRSYNGLVWADPIAGEWCWFTTEQSNIVEDSENNLWIEADGKLYKNALNP
jgi:hypothetical protein